jgi:hypothetical protein
MRLDGHISLAIGQILPIGRQHVDFSSKIIFEFYKGRKEGLQRILTNWVC